MQYKGIAGGIMRVLDGSRAAALYTSMPKPEADAFFAAGGPSQGVTWGWPKQRLDNDIFRVALLRRAHALVIPDGINCKMPFAETSKKAGDCCEKPLTCSHELQCSCGSARMRPHRLVQQALARVIRGCGVECDVERYVPHLSSVTWDAAGIPQPVPAILDVVAIAGNPPRTICIDVTIRNPAASRYESVAQTDSKARSEKLRRYSPDVLPLVLNPQGRIQTSGQTSLDVLAQALAASGTGRPYTSIFNQLAEAVELALHQGIADTTLKFLGDAARVFLPPSAAASPPSQGAFFPLGPSLGALPFHPGL
jgi:hypothetical protein